MRTSPSLNPNPSPNHMPLGQVAPLELVAQPLGPLLRGHAAAVAPAPAPQHVVEGGLVSLPRLEGARCAVLPLAWVGVGVGVKGER